MNTVKVHSGSKMILQQLWSISEFTAGIMRTLGSGLFIQAPSFQSLKVHILMLSRIDCFDKDNRDNSPCPVRSGLRI